MFLFKLEADGIVSRVGDVRKAFGHAHYKEDGGVDAHGDTGIALFNLEECHSADRGALRHDGHGDTAPPPSPILYSVQ